MALSRRDSTCMFSSCHLVQIMQFLSSLNTAFNIYVSPSAKECSGVCGHCIHSLVAQAGPITQLTHAWDRPSVIQIVCTTYDSSTRKETWQPLISEELSVGQASGVSIAQAPRGGRGDGRGRRRGGSKGRDRIEGGKCMMVEVKKNKIHWQKSRWWKRMRIEN